MTIEYGWKCPSCGAVMAPWQKACVNCSGNSNSSPITMKEDKVVVAPNQSPYEQAPWWANPNVYWEVTCGPKTGDPIGFTSVTTSKNPNCTITAWNKNTPKTSTSDLKNSLKSAGINT